ncbi:MAG: polysaccharide pyruvyl transferase family protein [Lentisphaerae bacterium]|nr:polysaccharide pyruvyl transferase family protein [Lentisphaerota bacterium]
MTEMDRTPDVAARHWRRPNSRDLARLRRSSRFDGRFYLLQYPDVAAARVDPLWHFVLSGAAEGRHPHRGFQPGCNPGAEAAADDGLHPALQYLLEAPPLWSPPVGEPPLRVLLDTPRGVHVGENLGDVAMCAAAMLRVSELAPGCTLFVVVDDPRVLAFTGVRYEAVPSSARQHWLRDPAYAGGRRFAEALGRADVVATTGHGALVDFIVDDSVNMLRVLSAGRQHGALTAILGHGLGPFSHSHLRAVASAVLPTLDLLCVREEQDAPALLAELNVPAERVVVTGDDATRICVPPWTASRRAPAASGLGLSWRLGYGMTPELAPHVVAMAKRLAEREHLRVVPLPIDCGDAPTLSGLGFPCVLAESPADFMAQAGRCRVVLAGSYHAAVLSLSQGVPTVVLSAGPFYHSKMAGLARWFAPGCRRVDLDADPTGAGVADALAWAAARGDDDRRELVAAAREQIERGNRALAGLLARAAVPRASAWRRVKQELALRVWRG